MKPAGYTIIELIVALAISAVLLALTVPRYDFYQNHLTLRNSVHLLATCMQDANAAVTSPESGVVASVSTVMQSTLRLQQTAAGQIDCQQVRQDSPVGGSVPLSVPLPVRVNNIFLCSSDYGATSTANSSLLPVAYTLQARTRGVVDAISYSNGVPLGKAGSGQGQQEKLTFSDSSSCADTVTLTIPVTGSPIEISG